MYKQSLQNGKNENFVMV